jgi:hypothetical protein
MSLYDILPGAEVDAHVLDANFKELNRLVTEETLNRKTAINNLEGTKANNIDVAKISERSNMFNVDNVFNKNTTFNDNVLFNNTKETDEAEDVTTTFETKVVFNNEINAKNKVVFEKEIKLTDEMYSSLCTKMMPNWIYKQDRLPNTEYTESQNGYLFICSKYQKNINYCISFAENKEIESGTILSWFDYKLDITNEGGEGHTILLPISKQHKYKIQPLNTKGEVTTAEFAEGFFQQLCFIPCIGG